MCCNDNIFIIGVDICVDLKRINYIIINMHKIIIKSFDLLEFLKQNYGIGDNVNDTDIPSTRVDLYIDRTKRSKKEKPLLFFDQNKYQLKFWSTMTAYTNAVLLPHDTTKPCWQCRLKINKMPLGCPLKYFNAIKDPVMIGIFKTFLISKNYDIPEDENDLEYFESEGMFCRLSCIKSYILEQLTLTKLPKYRKALTLLKLLQTILSTDPPTPIITAISWKLNQEWGGPFTPTEYRALCGKKEFQQTINIKRPCMLSSGTYFQELCIKT